MALVRILVDGYSLLHSWPALARGKPRHSEAARDELIRVLTQYRDSEGTPITIFFDGTGPVRGRASQTHSSPEVEILFSRSDQTADQMIERAAHRFRAYGEVLVVTNDYAERDTVVNMGGLSSSCENFIRAIETAIVDLQNEIKQHNRSERHRFIGRSGHSRL